MVARRQVLAGQDAQEFEQAIIHSGIFEHWLEELRRGRVPQRVRAVMDLGLVRKPRSVEALVAARRDPSPQLILAAVLGLGRLRDAQGLPGLTTLTGGRAPRFHEAAGDVLSRWPSRVTIRWNDVARCYSSPDIGRP